MRFRFSTLAGRAWQEATFQWRPEGDRATVLRDLTWDFAEPDQYPDLVGQHKVGMLTGREEKAFHAAVAHGDPEEMLHNAGSSSQYLLAAQVIAGLLLLEAELDRGIDLLREATAGDRLIEKDHFVRKYLPEAGLSVVIAAGLMARLPLQRNSIILLLAELYQARDLPDLALSLLESSEQTTHIRLSKAELLYEAQRFEDVVQTTEGVINDDDFTALLLAYRGRSLGALGRDQEAVSVLARVLEYPNRADAIKAIALVGRGIIHQARGNPILADNDFTQALVEMPENEEARHHIEELARGSENAE